MGIKYDPETKRQIMQWTSKSSPRPKMFCLQKSNIKTVLISFFDKQNVVHKEFYVEVIGILLKRILQMKPQFRAGSSWFLLHDNAPSHSAPVVKTFLAKHGVAEISHPPYSPDLAPANIFSFLR
jgi:hypothetical protein